MKHRLNILPDKYQLGNTVNTTFGVQPIVTNVDRIDPNAVTINPTITPFSAQPFFQAKQLNQADQRLDLAERRFDFDVQKEISAMNNEFLKSVTSANKNLRDIKANNSGLNPGYKRNEAALTKSFNITQGAQEAANKLFKTANSSNLGTLSSDLNKIRLQSQRDIELNSGIIEEGVLDKKFDALLVSLDKDAKNGVSVNRVAFAELIDKYETYKNDVSPTADFDESILNKSLYLFNQDDAISRADKVIDLINKGVDNEEVLTKELGIPRGFIAQVKRNSQNPLEMRKEYARIALGGDPQIQSWLSSTGVTVDDYANSRIVPATRATSTEISNLKDTRIKNKTTAPNKTADEKKSESNRLRREEVLTEIGGGNKTFVDSLVGGEYDGQEIVGASVKKEGLNEYFPGLTEDIDSNLSVLVLEFPSDGFGDEGSTIPILIDLDSKTGLAEVNNILNTTVRGADTVPVDDLIDYLNNTSTNPAQTNSNSTKDTKTVENKDAQALIKTF